MDFFAYKDDSLMCEESDLTAIAEAVGTPFYCYSERTILRHLRVFQEAFALAPHLICYSVKANSNLAILNLLRHAGSGFDIVSGGELERVKRVGCDPEKVVFSGVGKTEAEIRAALEFGVRMFNVESAPELRRINEIAGEMGKVAPIALRVNPDVDAKTHPYISTGLKRNKFGIPHEQALELYREAAQMPNIRVRGLDCHIGSQLTQVTPFVDALKRVKGLLEEIAALGIEITDLDLGGGLGIPYEENDNPPSPQELAQALLTELGDQAVTVLLEPGRAIVGNAGILVARVEYVKETPDRDFIITDAGMNDLMRPTLYKAYHGVLPVTRHFDRDEVNADVVGPICETGDYFAQDRYVPKFREGELLAVRSAGAYGFVMSGNYNSRPKVAEVLVRGDQYAVARQRETLDQLLNNDVMDPQFNE
ncbi:diaminopimelate decarboxylase [Magnetofaba australis]|uniref:Diaminopimelate decarboxylase n=1 Tax=Magnetofaba australis IT-1 TaxID=1434232 RepID=A0A1Y2K731_9PROT|nr:diaminopimelate decarboxylase [Magnetofaba australis]OSM06126.1 putative diaminopimelate decarboxylase [Magnetofaba australis IT-1]